MEQSKKEFLPVLQGVKLSKTQDPTIVENRKRMKVKKYRGSIVVLSISKSVEPNEELKVE